MGTPSGCSVSVPLTVEDAPWGGFMEVVPCAVQPPPDAVISKSSCPTDLPSSKMLNLPFSGANREPAATFFCAAVASSPKAMTYNRTTLA